MTRSRLFVLSLATLLAAACSSASSLEPQDTAAADPIVGGKPDKKDRAVVAIEIGGTGLCTGTLIGPRHVLTARHCVSETAAAVSCPSTGPQIGADRDPSTLVIVVGENVKTGKQVARGAQLFTPPGNVLCGHDIAIIELDTEITAITPATVAGKGVLTPTTTLRAVGYGRRDDASNAGKRLARGGIPILAETARELETGEATCSGDSGGPAFDEQSGAVVGVVSRGVMPCASPDAHNVFTRTDAFAALIQEALGDGTGAGGAGDTADPPPDVPPDDGAGGAAGHHGHGHGHGGHGHGHAGHGHGHAGHGHGHAGHGHVHGKHCFSDTNCPSGQTCNHGTHRCE